MARRDELRVSLFPFMSVLACTIGALTLLLASLSLSAVAPSGADPRMDGEAASARARPSDPEVARPGAEASEKSEAPAPVSEADLARIEALWRRVDAALARGEPGAAISLDALERRLASGERMGRLEADLKALIEAERALAQEGEEIETSIEVLESRRETLPILIDPTGLSRHLEPWFVECDAGGVTAYRVSDGLSHFVPRDALDGSGDFARYLRRLKVSPGALLVLLVRPDGLETSALASRMAEAMGVRSAQLPLPGRGELDWSLLRRAEEAKAR